MKSKNNFFFKSSIVAGGHGCTPMLFNVNGNGEISFVSKLEEDKKTETNSKFSAKALFQTRDKMGVSDVADTVLNTTHQNQVCFYECNIFFCQIKLIYLMYTIYMCFFIYFFRFPAFKSKVEIKIVPLEFPHLLEMENWLFGT